MQRSTRRRPRLAGLLLVAALLITLLVALVAWLNLRGEATPSSAPAAAPDPGQVQRGAYLARAGNCAGCHTAPGGAAYAGGAAIPTPFGTVFASNLTPDTSHGLGRWNSDHFWRALHHGRSLDGRLLLPAFPYPNFTQVTRADSDALFAYLQTVPAAAQPNRAHALRFPYNLQLSLALWRALFFRADTFQADSSKPADWNRGAYLVRGLGHCVACHSTRNLLGATSNDQQLTGGLIPMQGWYAPSLASPQEAGVQGWDVQHVVALLKTGTSPRGQVMGPMAEVVFNSTQHLSDGDVRAMAAYLQDRPSGSSEPSPSSGPALRSTVAGADAALLERGDKLYTQHCAACHGDQGQGAPGAYPALAGNRTVLMGSPVNAVRAIVLGGFAPATAGNPRPYGMPPFGQVLDDTDVAALATHIRTHWGNTAPPVSVLDVLRTR